MKIPQRLLTSQIVGPSRIRSERDIGHRCLMFLLVALGWYNQERGYLTGCWTGPEAGYSYPRKVAEGPHQNMQTHNSIMPLYTAYARKAHHAPKHNRIRKPHGPLFTKVPPYLQCEGVQNKRLTPNMHIGWMGCPLNVGVTAHTPTEVVHSQDAPLMDTLWPQVLVI